MFGISPPAIADARTMRTFAKSVRFAMSPILKKRINVSTLQKDASILRTRNAQNRNSEKSKLFIRVYPRLHCRR